MAIEHFKSTVTWNLAISGASEPPDIPTVPLDARPHIGFAASLKDTNLIGVNTTTPEPGPVIIGDPETGKGSVQVQYELVNVIVEKKTAGTYTPVTPFDGIKNAFGSWAVVPAQQDPSTNPDGRPEVANTKLWLWSKSPFDATRQIDNSWNEWVADTFKNYPCPTVPVPKQTCYNFQKVSPDILFDGQFIHPEEPGLVISWQSPEFKTITVLKGEKIGPYDHAFCTTTGNDRQLGGMVISLPQEVSSVILYIGIAESVYVICEDQKKQVTLNQMLKNSHTNIYTLKGIGKIRTIRLLRGQQYCLAGICLIEDPTPEETKRYADLLNHLTVEVGRWSGVGNVLEPYTNYRLKISTKYTASGMSGSALSGWSNSPSFDDYVYFRTDGPPGIAALTPPTTQTNAVIEKNDGLKDLTLYVKQTVPSTLPTLNQQPVLQKPVYRAYDIGLEFNEDYVDLMYKISGRDLNIYLYNSNNLPVRDAEGKLIVISNQWGKAEELTLLQSESDYIQMLHSGSCANLDTSTIPRDNTLVTISPRQVLDPDIVYQARLNPLLLAELFATDKGRWRTVTDGTQEGPAQWQWISHPAINGTGLAITVNKVVLSGAPDLSTVSKDLDGIFINGDTTRVNHFYKVLSVDNVTKTLTLDGNPIAPTSDTWQIPGISAVVQQSNVWAGTDDREEIPKLGTMYVLDNVPGQVPAAWSDLRLTVVMRSVDDDTMGLVFRYNDAGGTKSYYRFSMDRQLKYRRLVKCVNNLFTVLSDDDFVYTQDVDYTITVECIANSIRVYQNGELLFDILDSSISAGTIGLYCWANEGVRFSQVYVDDFRINSITVYQFSFTTSVFTNFLHHLQSYQDETWNLLARAAVNIDDYISHSFSPAGMITVNDDEFKLYEELTAKLLGGNANQPIKQVQVFRINLENDITKGFLLRTPEPLLWERLVIQLNQGNSIIEKGATPADLKIIGVNIGSSLVKDESVTMIIRNKKDINGCKLQFPGFNAAPLTKKDIVLLEESFDYTAGLLYQEKFGGNALDSYMVIDEVSGPSYWKGKKFPKPPFEWSNGFSAWSVSGNSIVQISNIYGGSFINPLEAPGTLAILKDKDWDNIKLQSTIRSTDNDGLGIVFRFKDDANYYRFSMDRQHGFRRLIKKKGGVVSNLWEDHWLKAFYIFSLISCIILRAIFSAVVSKLLSA